MLFRVAADLVLRLHAAFVGYRRFQEKEASVEFPAWETFYVIVGSSAGALTGLMFVGIALIADFRGGSESQVAAFGTPTVVHFGAVLLLSAIVTAPWPTMLGIRLALALLGIAGVVYMIVVLRRTTRQTAYAPVLEDWLFHAILPVAAYVAILTAAAGLQRRPVPLLFVIGGAAVLLLFVGVHNAWDTVTYIITLNWERRTRERAGGDSAPT